VIKNGIEHMKKISIIGADGHARSLINIE